MRKERHHRAEWRNWREDAHRATRPAVTCENCDTHYPRGQDEGNARYEGYNLVECGACQEVEFVPVDRRAEIRKVVERITRKLSNHIAARTGPASEPEILFPHVYRRVFRDTACRYIRRFGGQTFSVQTAIDDSEIYLRNRHGLTIATVSLLNRFPEEVDTAIFDDMPF